MSSAPEPGSAPSGSPAEAPHAGARDAARGKRARLRRGLAAIVVVASLTAGAAFGYVQFRSYRLQGSVRRAFAGRRYDRARGLLDRWIMNQPRSGEAQYYRAWLALADDRPPDVVTAVERAKELGYDRARLEVLKAIYQA